MEECEKSLLDERETVWIDFYKNLNLTNILPGGRSYSPEKGANISISKKGEKNPMFGKKLSEAHKQKMQDGAKKHREDNGTAMSEESKQKLSKAQSFPVLVLNENFDTVLEFESVKKCAEHFGYKVENVQQAISRFRPVGRWIKKIYWIVRKENLDKSIDLIKNKPENEFIVNNKKYPLYGDAKRRSEGNEKAAKICGKLQGLLGS